MKITQKKLQQIILEEIAGLMQEQPFQDPCSKGNNPVQGSSEWFDYYVCKMRTDPLTAGRVGRCANGDQTACIELDFAGRPGEAGPSQIALELLGTFNSRK